MKALATMLTVPLLVALIAGCGSGGSGSVGRVAKGHEGTMMRCLEAREGTAGLDQVGRVVCARAGVTATSPSKRSQKAVEARAAAVFRAATYGRIRREEPPSEMRSRRKALADYGSGASAKARKRLEEGCVRASAHELEEAVVTLERLATEEPPPGRYEIYDLLEHACPL